MNFFDVLDGMWSGFQIFSVCLSCLLLLIYIGERSDAGDINRALWYLLFTPFLAYINQIRKMYYPLKRASTAYLIAFFAVFLAGAWVLVRIAIREYNRKNK